MQVSLKTVRLRDDKGGKGWRRNTPKKKSYIEELTTNLHSHELGLAFALITEGRTDRREMCKRPLL
jgi:hypothetical protein